MLFSEEAIDLHGARAAHVVSEAGAKLVLLPPDDEATSNVVAASFEQAQRYDCSMSEPATTSETPPLHAPVGCDGALVRAFRFLGKRWSGVVLGSLVHGPAGFRELSRAVGAISDSVLSDRLSELGEAGLVLRTVDPGPPVAVAYALTPAGIALVPALEELASWASQHLPAEKCGEA